MATSKKATTSVARKSVRGNETTTPAMAQLAAKTLKSKTATALEKKFAGALLNQAPDKKPVIKFSKKTNK